MYKIANVWTELLGYSNSGAKVNICLSYNKIIVCCQQWKYLLLNLVSFVSEAYHSISFNSLNLKINVVTLPSSDVLYFRILTNRISGGRVITCTYIMCANSRTWFMCLRSLKTQRELKTALLKPFSQQPYYTGRHKNPSLPHSILALYLPAKETKYVFVQFVLTSHYFE